MVVLAALALAVLAMAGAGALVRSSTRGLTYWDEAAIPHRAVGLVLGCSKILPDGRSNVFFQTRMDAAARLFKAGKVDALIVSGDNHRVGYDEPSDMKLALVQRGVPAGRIYLDYAGFRTLDSVVRAKTIFGQSSITVISQEFHNQRAIFIARHRGIDAIGFNARDVAGRHGIRTHIREYLARVRTVLDLAVGVKPKFGGPPVVIEPARKGLAGE